MKTVSCIANLIKKRDNVFMEVFNGHSPGKLRIGPLLFLALMGAGVYLGFQLAPYWINAYEMKDFLTEKARTGELSTDEDLRRAIIAKAAELDVALTDRDIEIHRSPMDISISTSWELNYNFFGLYAHTFTFAPQVTVKYR